MFSLLDCHGCGAVFKSPAIPEESLLACYEQASANLPGWTVEPYARRFDQVRDMLAAAPGRRVLDVGCYTGDFLHYLGTSWTRFGVEPNRSAAAAAAAKGIEILAPTVEDLPARTQPFDAIVLMDVMEHLTTPIPFLRQVADLLTPDGVVVIITGDASAPSARLMGPSYWYVALPEHVMFWSERSLRYAGELVGLRVERCRRLSHGRCTVIHRVRDVAWNLTYLALHRTGAARLPGIRRAVNRAAPGWLSAADHLFAVLRKNARTVDADCSVLG